MRLHLETQCGARGASSWTTPVQVAADGTISDRQLHLAAARLGTCPPECGCRSKPLLVAKRNGMHRRTVGTIGWPAAESVGDLRHQLVKPVCTCGEPMFRHADDSWQCRECDY